MAIEAKNEYVSTKTGLYRLSLGQSTLVLEIHSGTIPADIDGWDPSANTGTLLATFASGSFTISNVSFGGGTKLAATLLPSAVTASGTGTATWCVLYNNTTNNLAILVEPSLTGGNGGVQLNTLSMTSGVTSVDLLDINISFHNYSGWSH